MTLVRSIIDFIVAIFSHTRTPHCPCANCKIADLNDIVSPPEKKVD